MMRPGNSRRSVCLCVCLCVCVCVCVCGMFQSKISFFGEYLDYFVFRRATRICACSSLRMTITSRCRYSKEAFTTNDESSRFTLSFKIFSLCDGWEWRCRVSIWTGGLINKNSVVQRVDAVIDLMWLQMKSSRWRWELHVSRFTAPMLPPAVGTNAHFAKYS